MTIHTIKHSRPITPSKLLAASALWLGAAFLSPAPVRANDANIRHVLVISIDGMHSLDMALWVKNNPTSALAKLYSQGVN